MQVIGWLILDLATGFISRRLFNRGSEGFWLDVGLGVVGAVFGGFLLSTLAAPGPGLNIWSMIAAVIGTIVVLVTFHAVRRGR